MKQNLFQMSVVALSLERYSTNDEPEESSPVHSGRNIEVSDAWSDDCLSETESFVSETTDILDSESDTGVEGRWSPKQHTHGLSGYIKSSIARSSQCQIDGQYSSSDEDYIQGLDTDLPGVDPGEDFTGSLSLRAEADTDASGRFLC